MLRQFDRFKEQYPHFRANVFAIPAEMNRRWHQRISCRPWLRLYPHGMFHDRGECRERPSSATKRMIERLAGDERWGSVFKAPWHGYCIEFLELLHANGFVPAITNLHGFPYPMPSEWQVFSHREFIAASVSAGDAHRGYFIEAHPHYIPKLPGSRKSAMSPRHISWWTQKWTTETRWAFCDELLRPALMKLHLGCGPHVWDDWMCLDPRTELDERIVDWDWSRMLPVSDNKADIVFTSHTLNYLEEEKYVDAALDIWRVLRPGGIWRMAEDDTDNGYIWRRPGQRARGTGEILSLPTKRKILAAVRRAGFDVLEVDENSTMSPHRDVFRGNSRARHTRIGNKFYAEAIKDSRIDVSKIRQTDPRAVLHGRYRLASESA